MAVERWRFIHVGMDSPEPVPNSLNSLIEAAERGDATAKEPLFAALYAELHHIAKRELARHGRRGTIGATSLLHEAYLALSKRDPGRFPDEQRFMGYAARVMRGLIIDYSRSRQAQKRGGKFELTTISTEIAQAEQSTDLTSLGHALEELAAIEPALADVVDLKFFCGFTVPEIAAMKHVSERSIERSWQKARLFLHRSMHSDLIGE